MAEGGDLRRAFVLGVPVTACTFAAAVEWLAARVEERTPTYVSHANVYAVMTARRDRRHHERLAGAGLVTADGVPVVWALRLLGHRGAERVHGDDLFFALCRRLPERRHYLLGGAAGQPEAVAEALRRRYPDLCIAGCRATPVRPLPDAESERVLADVEASRADVVWVGMGTPEQDRWMHAHAARAGRPLVGVGSAFDLLAGRTRPAPRWMKERGLQWLFRLAQEPRRLWRRYLWNNPLFLLLLAREVVLHRAVPGRRGGGDEGGDGGTGGGPP